MQALKINTHERKPHSWHPSWASRDVVKNWNHETEFQWCSGKRRKCSISLFPSSMISPVVLMTRQAHGSQAAGTTRFQREKAETSLHRAYGSLCSVRGHDLPSRSARGLWLQGGPPHTPSVLPAPHHCISRSPRKGCSKSCAPSQASIVNFFHFLNRKNTSKTQKSIPRPSTECQMYHSLYHKMSNYYSL